MHNMPSVVLRPGNLHLPELPLDPKNVIFFPCPA
jgi:hypothetical protein